MNTPDAIEVVVLRTSANETKANGLTRTVTLMVPNDGEHPFSGMVGQRFHIVCLRINDDETVEGLPAEQAHQAPPDTSKRKLADMPAATQIALHCDRQAFWRYLREEHAAQVRASDDSMEWVKRHCGVERKRDVLPGTEAGARWYRLQHDFGTWMKEPVL